MYIGRRPTMGDRSVVIIFLWHYIAMWPLYVHGDRNVGLYKRPHTYNATTWPVQYVLEVCWSGLPVPTGRVG